VGLYSLAYSNVKLQTEWWWQRTSRKVCLR